MHPQWILLILISISLEVIRGFYWLWHKVDLPVLHTDSMEHDQAFGRLYNAKHRPYISVAILVTSCQSDKRVLNMVCCAGSTRWRKHKLATHDTVLLWMGMSLDCHCKLTAGFILVELKCLFVIEDAQSWVKGLLALVPPFGTKLIHQPAGTLIVKEWHQPAMQSLQDGSNHHRPLTCGRTPDVVPIRVIWGVLHLLQLMLEPDSIWWHLSNRINYNAVNLCYI